MSPDIAKPHTGARLFAGAVVALLLATGCTSMRPSGPQDSGQPDAGHRPSAERTPPSGTLPAPAAVADRIARRARALLDSPYRASGNDPRGFDCSGFTEYVFRSEGLALPRTASEQALAGSWVPADELRRGDLVFFGQRRGKPLHVGLVISRLGEPPRMIHASTSRGVVETDILSSTYWLERLLFGRRLLFVP